MQRSFAIDALRGISILLVILIHTSYYFIGTSSFAFFLWNYSQFCVPIFIFCSFYLYFQKDHAQFHALTFSSYTQYIRKRFIRLLQPYYLFLIPFLLLQLVVNPSILTTKYILQSTFLIGGVDIAWLVLLFLQLTLLSPLLSYAFHKQTIIFYLFFLLSALSSLLFILYPTPYTLHPTFTMWISWIVLFFFTQLFLYLSQQKRKLGVLLLASIGVYVVLWGLFSQTHHDLILRNNKYPPNLYYLSYGISGIIILYLLTPYMQKLKNALTFLSTNSYQLFFIHYFFLIWFARNKTLLQFPWYVFFGIVLIVSLIVLFGGNKIFHFIHLIRPTRVSV